MICSCQYKQKEHAVLSLGHPRRCLIFAKQAFCSKPRRVRTTDWIWTIMFKWLLENTQRKAMSSIPIGASIPIWLLFVFGSGGGVAKCKHLHSKYSYGRRGESSRQNLLNSSICFKDFVCGWLQRKGAETAINSLWNVPLAFSAQLIFDLQQN